MPEHPNSEFEQELRETLSAPEANPLFVRDLRARLIERSTMKQTSTRFLPRLSWGLALALLIALLVVSAPRAAEMLKQLLGYIPEVGFVQSDETLRVLAAPVTVTRGGVHMIIEKGTADPQRTILLQHIEGYPASFDPAGRTCDSPARLVLPDGTVVAETSYETSWDSDRPGSYLGRYEFGPLPAGELEATLEIPCLMYDPGYADFEAVLRFESANARDVLPVIELPTSASPGTGPDASGVEGFSIVLESETVLEDGYLLTGSYRWTDPRFDGFSVYPFELQVTDADGEPVSIEPADPGTANSDPAVQELPFGLRIHGRKHAFPLTLSASLLVVTLPESASFQFDAGPDPQVGQTWEVDLDVPVAGHTVHVQTIEVIAGRTPTELGFNFSMTASPGVMGATVVDTDPGIHGGGGGGGGGGGSGGVTAGPFQYGWAVEGYSPAGLKTFVVSDITVSYPGTWQVAWQPSQP